MNVPVNLLDKPVKQNLLGMTLQDLEVFFTKSGEKAFRASQVMKWLHQRLAADFDEMSKRLNNKVIFDGRNLYDLDEMATLGYTYSSIGRKSIK